VIRRALVPLASLALAALALAACGGGGSSAEDEIVAAIERAATTSAVGNCTKLETLRFVEQNAGTQGKAALEACEEEEKSGEEHAKEVKVTNVKVEGEKASAEARFVGGPYNAQTFNLALVEADGDWKLDQIKGFADYDGKALEETFLRRFEESPQGLSKHQYTCIAEGIGKADQAEAEAMLLSGSPTGIEELAKGCA
jgi:hypothetical protein